MTSQLNTQEILALADHIEALPPEKFDMNRWCGTAACIAGSHVAWRDPKLFDEVSERQWLASHHLDRIWQESARRLGFTIEIAGPIPNLTLNRDKRVPELYLRSGQPSNLQAAKVLRHLAATGKVDWSIAF